MRRLISFTQRVGFTLGELLTVIVIIALLAGMAIPRFAGAIGNQRLAAAAGRIVADLELARRQARLTSTTQTVVFSVASDKYQLPGMSDPDHPAGPYAVELSDEPYGAAIVSADFDGDATVSFNGFGMPDSGGTVVISVDKSQTTITLDADTGRASLP